MAQTGDKLITIIVAIIGVATLSVILSKKSNTADVIKSAGQALGSLLTIAVSPING